MAVISYLVKCSCYKKFSQFDNVFISHSSNDLTTFTSTNGEEKLQFIFSFCLDWNPNITAVDNKKIIFSLFIMIYLNMTSICRGCFPYHLICLKKDKYLH